MELLLGGNLSYLLPFEKFVSPPPIYSINVIYERPLTLCLLWQCIIWFIMAASYIDRVSLQNTGYSEASLVGAGPGDIFIGIFQ